MRLSEIESPPDQSTRQTSDAFDKPATPVKNDQPTGMRMSDVENFQHVDVTPDFQDGVFQIDPQEEADWKSQGKIGFFEQWNRLDKTEMIPFWGSGETAVKGFSLLNAVNRIKSDSYDDDDLRSNDIEKVSDFLKRKEEERVRGISMPGKILSGVTQLPAFMVEFAATGGLAALGKAGVKKVATVALKEGAEAGITKLAARIAAPVAGAAVRTAGMPQRILAQYPDRQIQTNFQLTEKGAQIRQEGQESPVTSAFKSIGDVMIENYSEAAGEWIAKAGGALVPKPLAKSMEKVFKRLKPNQAVAKLWTKAGYNGFLAELGEERLGDLIRAVTGVDTFGAKNPDQMLDRIISSIPTGEEMLVEAGILAFPGAAQLATSEAFKMIREGRGEQLDHTREISDSEADELATKPVKVDEGQSVEIAGPAQEEGFEDVGRTTPEEQAEFDAMRKEADEVISKDAPEILTEPATPEEEKLANDQMIEDAEREKVDQELATLPESTQESLQRISETPEFIETSDRIAELEAIVRGAEINKAIGEEQGLRKIKRFKDKFMAEELRDIPQKWFTSNESAPNLDELADELGISEKELIKRFQRATGSEEEIKAVASARKEIEELNEKLMNSNPAIKDVMAELTKKEPRFVKVTQKALIKRLFQARFKGQKIGFKEGREAGRKEVESEKQVVARRRNMIQSVREHYELTDNDLRKINQRDIRLMDDAEFHEFLLAIDARAAEFAHKRQLKMQIIMGIEEKELKKTDNLRQYMKFPTLDKMSIEQLNKFNRLIEDAQHGDEFLSVRKLQTVKNTELAGIKTVREAKEILAEKLGVPLSSIDNMKVDTLDKFRFDSILAGKNPFYRLLVDETNQALLDGEQRYMEMEKEVDELATKARASRKRSTSDVLAPTDDLVFEWMEAPGAHAQGLGIRSKAEVAKDMTPEELDLANYLQARFAQFRDYLIQHEVLKHYREDYITHIRRGFLETFKEESKPKRKGGAARPVRGILSAFKEVFDQYKEDQAIFKILDEDTQNILPLEKFFQFSVGRAGVDRKITPSKNVARAFKAYTKALVKKQSLDKIIPALDIYAYSLSPKRVTQTGLQMDRQLIKFVREWINNKKGRRSSLGGFLQQNGKIDTALKSINAFVTLIDLGLNVPIGIASQAGEQVSTFVNLGTKKYWSGVARMNTAKGKKIIHDNEAFIGKSPWADLASAADEVSDKFNKILFSLYEVASTRANKIHLLGSLTDDEWTEGKVSTKRLAELKREVGRYRAVAGAKSIFGSTSLGNTLTKYKSWALPILNTNIDNIGKIVGMIKDEKNFNKAVKSKEFQELFREVMVTSLVALAGAGMMGDDDDTTFLGRVTRKAYQDGLTILGSFDPTMLVRVRLLGFLGDLASALKMIATGEEYKSRPGYKGPDKLIRTVTPKALQPVLPDDKKKRHGNLV